MFYARKTVLRYWLFTAPVMLFISTIAGLYFAGAPTLVAALARFGIPLCALNVLGIVELLGVAAVVSNRVRVLKQWAYAGFTFEFVGAAASHLFAGDGIGKVALPLVLLDLLLASYAQWKGLGKAV